MRAAGTGLALIGRIILIIAAIVFLIIALGVLLILLDANPDNAIVKAITNAANFLAGPFKRLFTFDSTKLQTAINWGIGAFVWLILGGIIAGLLRRAGRSAA